MYDIKVSLDNEDYTSKPPSSEAAQISKRIGKNTEILNCPASLYEFVYNVSQQGHTFSPSTFSDGKRKSDNFEQMQLLVLDFDGGISYKEVRKRAAQYDVPFLFAYETFSSSEDVERFRVCFLNDMPLSNPKAAKIAKNLLRTIFPESDPHDNDIARMYYGGKRELYYNPCVPTVNLESLNRNAAIFLKDKDASNFKRQIAKFSRDNGVALNESKLLDISMQEISTENPGVTSIDENSPSTIIVYNKNNGEVSSNIYYKINMINDNTTHSVTSIKKESKGHNDFRSPVMGILGENCELYSKFKSGDKRLNHDELFGIGTNIIHIETGITRFLEILKQHQYYKNEAGKYDKWKKDMKYIKENDYSPMSCNHFCEYASSCSHAKNILLTCKPKSYVKLEGYNEEYVSINEVSKELARYLKTAIESDDTCIHIIKAQTSIGKTHEYIKQMKKIPQRFLVAAPTNILKNEIADRAKKDGLDIKKTPSLHEIKDIMPDDIWEDIEFFYQTGQHKKVHPYIEKVIQKQNIDCLHKYMKKIKFLQQLFRKSNKHMITTHRKLLNLNKEFLNNFGVVIIDEDIVLSSFVSNHTSVPLSDLKILAKDTTNPMLSKKIKELNKHIDRSETMFKLNSFKCDEDENVDISAGINIPAFCSAEYFYYRNKNKEMNLEEDHISFMSPLSLKEDVKYIIVSATADEEIYRYIFGNRVKFYECRKARYQGTLNQYVDKSFSRASIDSNPDILNRIIEKTRIKNLITFKKYNQGDLYIGNVEGSNIYEGKNINVVATPYEAEFIYKLFAFSLGLDFDYNDDMKTQSVARNGYIFEMKTYTDKILRNIQLWMMESHLEQAVGRSRLLRHNCVVNLFSKYPLMQSKIQYNFNYDD